MYELALYDQIGPYNYVRVKTERFSFLLDARWKAQNIMDTDHVDGARADRMRILDGYDHIVQEWIYGADDPDSDARWQSVI